MDNASFTPDTTQADLDKSWHIPRPTLARSSQSSSPGTNSSNSTQSVRSGSLLLTAANLAQIEPEQDFEDNTTLVSTKNQNIQLYLEQQNPGKIEGNDLIFPSQKPMEQDQLSIASSMHFTVVNVNTKPSTAKRSFCRKHQLTILVLTMCGLFTIGILSAIFVLEVRAKNAQRH